MILQNALPKDGKLWADSLHEFKMLKNDLTKEQVLELAHSFAKTNDHYLWLQDERFIKDLLTRMEELGYTITC